MSYKIMFYTNRKETQLGTVETIDDVTEFIMNYLNEINYKSYYQRYFGNDPMVIDFGEYNTFFHIYEV